MLQIFLENTSHVGKRTEFIILRLNATMSSVAVIKDKIRKGIRELAKDATPSSLSTRLRKLNARLDEDADIYKIIKNTVKSVMDLIPEKCSDSKEQLLPLQGKLWRSYSNKLKSANKSSQYKSLHDTGRIRQEMQADRMKQVEICHKLGPYIKTYLENLLKSFKDDNEFLLFVLLTEMLLDERSRIVLPDFLSKYQFDWHAWKTARDKQEINSIQQLRNELDKSEYNLAESSFGFEHLCREMGQIYEALSDNSSIPSNLEETWKMSPKIAVKLLMMGQPFEIMDGDAANVPMIWVKAVLSSLKDVIGDKKLLAISVLGIQSSGKSTLLNIMFGLQFAVSAGRCTRGVFMQLVPVEDKVHPFDYILVIDTEGLRAPKLAHQKHSHDNELATFVIGLGDITIVNIKGENTAELKDILQISVHAFLRLKLANEKLNLKQCCTFIHQNVPATDASEKMMQGRQKFVEVLDEMTKEAAAQENIADIQSFNQVIEFNSEQNVWYFSDLWRGDPPMAPSNPGYSENIAAVKESLLVRLTANRETYLTITDTISRIEDLWNGILKDDFVFSFRNSLELKAYNSMEQHCQAITWSLEKYVLEYMQSECKSSLLNCTDAQQLEKCVQVLNLQLSNQINTRVEDLIKKLDDFVDKSTLKDVMIQWVQHKRNRFKMLAENLLLNAKTDINNTKEEINITKRQVSEKIKHETEINDLARNLANEMKGKIPNEDILKNEFNSMWSKWINKFATQKTKDADSMTSEIESMLYEKFPSDARFIETIKHGINDSHYKTLINLAGSFNLEWIKSKDHLSIHKSVFVLKEVRPHACKQQTLDVLNMIFRTIDTRLEELNMQDIKFDIAYVTEILNIVTTGIADFNDHNTNEYKFNMLPTFRAKVILHVVRYASVFFTRLNNKYNKKHSLQAKMEEYKGAAWDLFKNVVQCNTEDVIATGFFREAITKVVTEHVEQLLQIDVQEKIVGLFAKGKYSAIKDILTNLANSESFVAIKSYIMNPSAFAESWILNLTNKILFVDTVNEMNGYSQLAKTRISTLFKTLSRSLTIVGITLKRDRTFNIFNWIRCFMDTNITMQGLPLSIEVFKHVQNSKISDLSGFHEMIIESLQDMEVHIIEHFKNKNKTSVKWTENPISKIMDKLWGCSDMCMFCKEPCINTSKDHVKEGQSHKCIQHRPMGIGGFRWSHTGKLVIEFCNYSVTTDVKFNFRSKGKSGYYKEYKKYFPSWDIPPNSNVSHYWMWLMNKYQKELHEMHDALLPDIPPFLEIDYKTASLR